MAAMGQGRSGKVLQKKAAAPSPQVPEPPDPHGETLWGRPCGTQLLQRRPLPDVHRAGGVRSEGPQPEGAGFVATTD